MLNQNPNSQLRRFQVLQGDVSDILPTLRPESFDAVLSDPPYGLKFMGKHWDHGVASREVWSAVERTLKPGAHLLAFGGTRTFHRLATAIEDAGFDIRDCLCWLYGQGFPKSHNLVGAFSGYGTALKPAWEPCILAMKPTDGTFKENAMRWGLAGLAIDAGRIGTEGATKKSEQAPYPKNADGSEDRSGSWARTGHGIETLPLGRFPANVILDEDAAEMVGEPSRFFYTAKASRREREAGLEGFEERRAARMNAMGDNPEGPIDPVSERFTTRARNHHPTVKPLALCEYLARLILPPKRDTPRRLLVPFSGSGSEMIGALLAGWDEVVGIEREAEYVTIAEARLTHWTGNLDLSLFDELVDL